MPRDRAERRAILENLDALRGWRNQDDARGMETGDLPINLSYTKQVNCHEKFELNLLEIGVLE